MNTASIKNFLMITLKNAVNAVLVGGSMKVLVSGSFEFSSAAAWILMAKGAGAAIVAREIVVWGPVVLSWSNTSATPVSMKQPPAA